MLGGGGGVSHPSQLTTGLVIKSVTTSPTLAGERMLFILQVSILSEQRLNCNNNDIFSILTIYFHFNIRGVFHCLKLAILCLLFTPKIFFL